MWTIGAEEFDSINEKHKIILVDKDSDPHSRLPLGLDVLGSVYNRRIYSAICELYNHVTQELVIQEDARILYAGSGRGYISLVLAANNPQAMITGIDYSFMQVREVEKYRRKRKIANCSFQQGNAMNIEFADETFDGSVSVGSIKHCPDALRGLKEIHRVLKPGRHLIISETDQKVSDNKK